MNLISVSEQLEVDRRGLFRPYTPSRLEQMLRNAISAGQATCTYIESSDIGDSLGAFVTEPLCFAVAVPDASFADWVSLTTDWLVPHCEVNHIEQTARSLVLLGDGPLAVPMNALMPALFDAAAVFVLFLTSAGTLAVKYRWNEKFLASFSAADRCAETYEVDEYESARMISIGSAAEGCSRAKALVPVQVSLDEVSF